MNLNAIRNAALRKTATAVLTPEAEQAAMAGAAPGGMPPDAGAMPPGGMPPDTAAGAMPPGGAMPPDAAGGMPPGGGAPGGAPGLPPEILQDQAFIQWMEQKGAQFDPNSATFIDMATQQPIPPDMVMQAYQMYIQESQGGAPAGAPGGAMPPDAAAAGGMPPGGAMPPDAGAMPPADGVAPAPDGGAAPGGAPAGDMMQDQEFLAFMQQAMGLTLDPASGTFVDPSGQPIGPDMVQSAYEQFQMAKGQPGGEGQPGGGGGEGGGKLPPEILEQIQSVVDSSLDAYKSSQEKWQQAMSDKMDKLLMAVEAMADTNDQRDEETRKRDKEMQDDIRDNLNPKVASAQPPVPLANAISEELDIKPAEPEKKDDEPRYLDISDIMFGGAK